MMMMMLLLLLQYATTTAYEYEIESALFVSGFNLLNSDKHILYIPVNKTTSYRTFNYSSDVESQLTAGTNITSLIGNDTMIFVGATSGFGSLDAQIRPMYLNLSVFSPPSIQIISNEKDGTVWSIDELHLTQLDVMKSEILVNVETRNASINTIALYSNTKIICGGSLLFNNDSSEFGPLSFYDYKDNEWTLLPSSPSIVPSNISVSRVNTASSNHDNDIIIVSKDIDGQLAFFHNNAWTTLNNGGISDGDIHASMLLEDLQSSEYILYVGGTFTVAGNESSRYIAQYSLRTNNWIPFLDNANEIDAPVTAFTFSSGILYVATFAQTSHDNIVKIWAHKPLYRGWYLIGNWTTVRSSSGHIQQMVMSNVALFPKVSTTSHRSSWKVYAITLGTLCPLVLCLIFGVISKRSKQPQHSHLQRDEVSSSYQHIDDDDDDDDLNESSLIA